MVTLLRQLLARVRWGRGESWDGTGVDEGYILDVYDILLCKLLMGSHALHSCKYLLYGVNESSWLMDSSCQILVSYVNVTLYKKSMAKDPPD